MHPLSFAIFPTWPFKPPIQISENFHKTRIKRPKKIKNEKDFSFSGEVGIREKQMKKLPHEILFSVFCQIGTWFIPSKSDVERDFLQKVGPWFDWLYTITLIYASS